MCGIFGIIEHGSKLNVIHSAFKSLASFSQSRGQQAGGVAFYGNDDLKVLKGPVKIMDLLKNDAYSSAEQSFLQKMPVQTERMIFGHARLVTNGSEFSGSSNHPIVINKNLCLVHNGIVTNYKEFLPNEVAHSDTFSDSASIALFLEQKVRDGLSLNNAFNDFQDKLQGTASIGCLVRTQRKFVLFSNTGSLYAITNPNGTVFASEKLFLSKLLKKYPTLGRPSEIFRVPINTPQIINLERPCEEKQDSISNRLLEPFSQKLISPCAKNDKKSSNSLILPTLVTHSARDYEDLISAQELTDIKSLQRCSRCILPSSFPNIKFDDAGICNFCHDHKPPQKLLGSEELISKIERFAQEGSLADLLVFLSGGRDSCYALHLLDALDIKISAYTYDWGMLTDIGRRNSARVCGELGIEQILVSADINKKRANIKRNIQAWLKRPRLGTIPLFMAGDKHYFYYGNKVQKELGCNLAVYSMNNLEKTDFKNQFCGVQSSRKSKTHFALDFNHKLKLASYFGKEFILNKSYLNRSLVDTFNGYLSYYFCPQNYLFLYDYLEWNEQKVNQTLTSRYGWEVERNFSSTWRIGDGLAPLYNLLYYKMSGFTENDTFRSNQIRNGLISRSQALELVGVENLPRQEGLQWCFETISLDPKTTLPIIKNLKKHYLADLV